MPFAGEAYELMFDEGTLDVLSYHPATVLAEKLETVLRRGEANTRGRDFYDLYAIPKYYSEAVGEADVSEALLRTSEKRGLGGKRLRIGLRPSRLFARRTSCIAYGIRTSRTTYTREGSRLKTRLNPSKS